MNTEDSNYNELKECLKECGLTTLETRWLRREQILVFKILNGYENIDRNIFFSLKKDSSSRGHEVTLVTGSVNMFKNMVDTYLRRAGYV